MKRVLVFGATGFVGRHVCSQFTEEGDEVITASRGGGEPHGADHLTIDLAEASPLELAELLARIRPDTVVNAVGSIWGASDTEMERRCLTPVRTLVEALSLIPGTPRLVHLGSVLEHGSPPSGAYGRAKRAATQEILLATAEGRIEGTVLRVANVIGPGTPEISLLGKVAGALTEAKRERGEAVVELAPLRAQRDFVDVRDVAEAVCAAARSDPPGAVVDIGSGHSVPVREPVDLLVSASGVPARVIESPPPVQERAPRTEDRIVVDTARAWSLLGWRPRRTLAAAVTAYWRSLEATP
ncbi:NAD-dependent epimerase/dehydratase family protein [Nocardiopsis suaedae]|uniref:NAD-dependent epimerase/dehydratase family protein n=1 Tax=Nocardiopsis suaedae TaxID=3018444 RepID=A0ABT4TQM4_9ACTN|nr:NAD-dependent epimerase/dehydratase family protein [Nocardiopsis suaedae]MDA2806971.1 NAD-dependent epimerase/dehydratase family protein [Nocardiopsis suaedae]